MARKEKSIPQRVIIQKKSMSRTSSTLSNQFPRQFFMLSMTRFFFCFVFFIFLFAAPRYLNSFAPGYFAKETLFETGRAVFCSVSCQKEAKLPNYRKIIIYASISLKNSGVPYQIPWETPGDKIRLMLHAFCSWCQLLIQKLFEFGRRLRDGNDCLDKTVTL